MGNVMLIPARRQVGSNARKKEEEKPKLRVAAYCRVSTDSDEQNTIQNIFRRTRIGNSPESMQMTASPAPTPKSVKNSTA